MKNDTLPPVVAKRLQEILSDPELSFQNSWLEAQRRTRAGWWDGEGERELRHQATEFLRLLSKAIADAPQTNARGSAWDEIREMLTGLSRSQAAQGFPMSAPASFVLTLKRVLYLRFRVVGEESPEDEAVSALLFDLLPVMDLLDTLALFAVEAFQRTREAIILRQQEELLELSTPVVTLWDGVLALPLVGTLDSARSQVVMESLLQAIADSGSRIAIIDITGVPTVDTLVSQHLLKTVAAARLMGAECILSGIRPQIAQTVVHLGVDLTGVITKATLAEALRVAIDKIRSHGRRPSAPV